MSTRRRLTRLEHAAAGWRCGLDCPPIVYHLYRQHGLGEPVIHHREGDGRPCPRCGRAAELVEHLEIVVSSHAEVVALKERDRLIAGDG